MPSWGIKKVKCPQSVPPDKMSAPYLIMSHFRPGGKRTNSSERIIFVWTLFYRVRVRLWDLETNSFYAGKKWKSLTPSERAPCVQEAEKLRLKHMQVRKKERIKLDSESLLILGDLNETKRSSKFNCLLQIFLSSPLISLRLENTEIAIWSSVGLTRIE